MSYVSATTSALILISGRVYTVSVPNCTNISGMVLLTAEKSRVIKFIFVLSFTNTLLPSFPLAMFKANQSTSL